jgi:hypothetical protein
LNIPVGASGVAAGNTIIVGFASRGASPTTHRCRAQAILIIWHPLPSHTSTAGPISSMLMLSTP